MRSALPTAKNGAPPPEGLRSRVVACRLMSMNSKITLRCAGAGTCGRSGGLPARAARSLFLVGWLVAAGALAAADHHDDGPGAEEQQLPRAMHSRMQERARVTVGFADAAIVGADNRALQAAVDYVAGLGGGVVEIGAGEFLMRDSLHLRSFVTVRGTKGKTILHKAPAAVSPLAVDGDYGEEQFTVINAQGFRVGDGVTVWDKQ